MKLLKETFNNMKFRTKTLIALLSVSMIPLLLLGGFCFVETRSILVSQARRNLNTSMEQAVLSMNGQLENYNKISGALCYNKSLAIAANTEYTTPFSMFEQLNYTIDELFLTTRNLANGINSITLYTGTNLPAHGKTVSPIQDARNQKWYRTAKDSVSIQWHAADNELFCIQPVLYTNIPDPKKNLVVMNIQPDQIFSAARLLAEKEIGVLITDSEQNVIYEASPHIPSQELINLHDPDAASKGITSGGKHYTIMESNITASGWHILIYVPDSSLTDSAVLITLTIAIIILLCIILVYYVSRLFTGKIVYRIEELRENMKEIENGSMEVTVISGTGDEIGELVTGFSHMVGQINHLIQDNYQKEIQRREFEMKALQAQINPHFLYNSLSLINWRALRIHADDISEMAQLLSSFYRTTLNKGSNMISVADELLNVKSYMNIQLIMHSDSFDAEYNISDTVLHYRMPNLMLQPLVENSIMHGIENLLPEERRGRILLTCAKEDDCLIFTVKDNGIGIEKSELELLLHRNTKGYGLKNINDRAILLFGEPYGLTLFSTSGEGTEAVLKIPLTCAPIDI